MQFVIFFYDSLSDVFRVANEWTEEETVWVWLSAACSLGATSWLSLYQIIVQIHFPLQTVLGTREGRGWVKIMNKKLFLTFKCYFLRLKKLFQFLFPYRLRAHLSRESNASWVYKFSDKKCLIIFVMLLFFLANNFV